MKNLFTKSIINIIFGIVTVILLTATILENIHGKNDYESFFQDKDFKEGDLIVMMKDNSKVSELASDNTNINLVATELLSKDLNIWLFKYDINKAKPTDALISVLKNSNVISAQFNHKVTFRSTFPNDARFNEQWDKHNTGQNGGTPDADIDAPEAWDMSKGGTTSQNDTIVVAIVDKGIDVKHSDLNIWKNYKEIPSNGIDEDSNGYVDDIYGWNASSNTAVIPADSHGTHVAGIAGARGNNSIGVAGVNWNVKTMSIVFGDTPTYEEGVVRAYSYVLTQRKLYNQYSGTKGAFIVAENSSFGYYFGNPENFPLWCAFYDSLGKAGILSAGAGPNLPINVDRSGDIPTTCPSNYLISVTNTTNKNMKNILAGYGQINIDLGAPGTNILSTIPNNNYTQMTGTSMSTPQVTGAIGLMYAAADSKYIELCKTKPDSVALIFKNFILSSVDTLQSLKGRTVSNGKLNIYKLLKKVVPNSNSKVSNIINSNNNLFFNYKLDQNFPNPFNPKTTINFSIPQKEFVTLKIYDAIGNEITSIGNNYEKAGSYEITFDGSKLSSGIYFYKLVAGNFAETKKMILVK